MYSLLRVFTIIDINYIIGVYANTRTHGAFSVVSRYYARYYYK